MAGQIGLSSSMWCARDSHKRREDRQGSQIPPTSSRGCPCSSNGDPSESIPDRSWRSERILENDPPASTGRPFWPRSRATTDNQAKSRSLNAFQPLSCTCKIVRWTHSRPPDFFACP